MKQIKTINALTKELCEREGKKVGVNVAQMKEIVGCLSDIFSDTARTGFGIYDLQELAFMIEANGQKRKAKGAKEKKAAKK